MAYSLIHIKLTCSCCADSWCDRSVIRCGSLQRFFFFFVLTLPRLFLSFIKVFFSHRLLRNGCLCEERKHTGGLIKRKIQATPTYTCVEPFSLVLKQRSTDKHFWLLRVVDLPFWECKLWLWNINDLWSSSWVKTTQWWSVCDFFSFLKSKLIIYELQTR